MDEGAVDDSEGSTEEVAVGSTDSVVDSVGSSEGDGDSEGASVAEADGT